MEHQERYCLTENHSECSVYQASETLEFPAELKQVVLKANRQKKPWQTATIVAGLAVAGVLIWFGYQSLSPALPAETATFIPLSTATQALQPELSATPSPTPTEEPTAVPPTATLIPTETRLPPQIHGLEIPISVDEKQFLIHRVIDGEQMVIIARNYKTSIDVIQALNNGIPQALWAGTAIVIAPGLLEVDPTLPAFTTYNVTETEIVIEDLAIKLNTDLELFLHFNRCEPGCLLESGDWVMVPVKK